MQLILHIGLPKTATTTIQHVLDSEKPRLAESGVLYPGTTETQLELVRRSQFGRLEQGAGPGTLGEALGLVAQEIRTQRPERVVLSCERMVLVSPGAVARLQRAVAAWLPEVREVRILCYVREPISWATSLCQQRLKMGTTRLEAFLADPWPLRIGGLLANYVERYGRSAITLRHLHPEALLRGNVVDDFLAAIGLEGFAPVAARPVLNRSLSRTGAQVADALADLVPRGQRKGRRKHLYRKKLQAIDGPPFVLPVRTQERIALAARPDLDYIRKTWGLQISPQMVDPGPEEDLDAPSVQKIARRIMAEVEEALAGPAP